MRMVPQGDGDDDDEALAEPAAHAAAAALGVGDGGGRGGTRRRGRSGGEETRGCRRHRHGLRLPAGSAGAQEEALLDMRVRRTPS